jgi:hypothetical protein
MQLTPMRGRSTNIFWEIHPNHVDRTHGYGYGCSIVPGSRRMHQVLIWSIYKNLMHILLVIVDHWFETSWTTLICIYKFFSIIPRWRVYLAKIPHSFNFVQLSCFCDICIGTSSIGECHQKFHAPSWETIRLDVLDSLIACQAMLEIDEET